MKIQSMSNVIHIRGFTYHPGLNLQTSSPIPLFMGIYTLSLQDIGLEGINDSLHVWKVAHSGYR